MIRPIVVAVVTLLALAGCGRADTAGAPSMDDAVVRQTVVVDPSEPRDSVELGVRSLEVKDDLAVLRLLLRPRFASAGDRQVSLYDMGADDPLDPFLTDAENLTRYDVLRDNSAPYRWETEPVGTKVANEEVLEAVYVFAAPPAEVRTVDLRFRQGWPAFLDVPVER